MTTIYLRLAIILAFLAALAAQDWWVYTKGKDSVFKGIIAGQATFQKEQSKAAVQDIAQATADSKTITQLEVERDNLRKKLQAAKLQKTTPSNTSVAPSQCTMPDSVLDELRKAADATKQS